MGGAAAELLVLKIIGYILCLQQRFCAHPSSHAVNSPVFFLRKKGE
jgi:hypothetical protein